VNQSTTVSRVYRREDGRLRWQAFDSFDAALVELKRLERGVEHPVGVCMGCWRTQERYKHGWAGLCLSCIALLPMADRRELTIQLACEMRPLEWERWNTWIEDIRGLLRDIGDEKGLRP
jgi:hypothetical protein